MKRAVVAAVLVAVSLATPLVAHQGVIIEQVIVKVNGDVFSKGELEQLQIAALRNKNRQVAFTKDLSDATLKPLLAEITPGILVDVVDEMLMVQRGRELGLHLSDEQFKGTVDDLKKQNNIKSDAEFQAALKGEGMTLADFHDRVERSMLTQKVTQMEVMQRVSLTDAEALQYYKDHQSDFLKPSTIVVREMLINVPLQTQGTQQVVNIGAADDAKEKLNLVLARLKKGEDFATVAKEVSQAPSKGAGGLLPAINEADLAKDVRDVFDKLKIGEVTEPILTTRGYQIFKLDSRTEATVEDFDKVREQIVDRVSNERMDAETKKYIEKLRAQAIIEWKNDDFKKLYEQQLAARDAK